MRGIIPVSTLIFILTYTPARAAVLAECGASYGQATYDGEGNWYPDNVSKGSFTFTADDKGNPNLIFSGTGGYTADAAADGAEIHFTFIHPDMGQFGIVVVYSDSGVVETYNVFGSSKGPRKLHWTSNKVSSYTSAKVAAFTASCD